MIHASRITVRAGAVSLLSDISLDIAPAEFVTIIGPNGAGKSTLLSVLSGERRVTSGTVSLEGIPLERWSVGALAQRRAVMSQHSGLTFPFTVAEVVALGAGRGGAVSSRDLRRFMETAHVAHLAHRLYPTLSGGERQRVHFARALAQIQSVPPEKTPVLMLDEPTSSLDPGHQHFVLAAARDWGRQRGGSVIAVLHDLTLAAQYSDRVVVVSDGTVRWQGGPDFIPLDLLEAVYGVVFRRVQMSEGETCCYIPVPSSTR